VHLPAAVLESVSPVLLSASQGLHDSSSGRNSLTITFLMSSLGRLWRGDGAFERCRELVAQEREPRATDVPACCVAVGCGCVSSLLSCLAFGRNAAHRDDGEAEIAHLVEDPVQGRLIGQRAGEDGLATLVVDL
jgi:hypothetical protein